MAKGHILDLAILVDRRQTCDIVHMLHSLIQDKELVVDAVIKLRPRLLGVLV
jgi:hypothetical protein